MGAMDLPGYARDIDPLRLTAGHKCASGCPAYPILPGAAGLVLDTLAFLVVVS